MSAPTFSDRAASITDRDVLEYLRMRAWESRIPDARVSVITDADGLEFSASAPNLGSANGARIYGHGPTAVQAVADMLRQMKHPREAAAALRIEAARLAALAASIEGGAP